MCTLPTKNRRLSSWRFCVVLDTLSGNAVFCSLLGLALSLVNWATEKECLFIFLSRFFLKTHSYSESNKTSRCNFFEVYIQAYVKLLKCESWRLVKWACHFSLVFFLTLASHNLLSFFLSKTDPRSLEQKEWGKAEGLVRRNSGRWMCHPQDSETCSKDT